MEKKNLLITGATCHIGFKLSENLCKDYNLTLLVRQNSKNLYHLDPIKDLVNIFEYESYDQFNELFSQNKFDCILHLATGNHSENIDSILETNIIFSTKLVKAYAESTKNGCFINTGTYSTYDQQGLYSPNNLYDSTKKAFEDILELYRVQNNLNILTLYFSHLYGIDSWQKRLMTLLIDSFKEDSQTLELTKGKEYVNHLFVEDVIRAFRISINLIESPQYQIAKEHKKYFAVSNETLTLKDTVEKIEGILGKKANVKWGARPYTKGNIIKKPYISGERLPTWEPVFPLQKVFEQLSSLKK